MLIEETTNLMGDGAHGVDRKKSGKAIAAYQNYMPESSSFIGAQQAYFEKSAGISESGTIDMATYSNPAREEKETVVEKLAKQENVAAENRKNQMVVVSQTTSAEDYKKLEEEGFSLANADSHTIITVTDKIKATLAEAGVDISQYGDSLSKEQLEEITGNPVVVNQIMQALEANDLPVTPENVEDSVDALAQAASIPQISDEAKAYLLKNDLEASIQNLYKAAHSSGAEGTVAVEESGIDFSELEPQIEQIIKDAGMAVDDSTIEGSKWLIANHIPLTAENLQYLTDLQDLSDQIENDAVDWNRVIDSMAKAITRGKRPHDALMITARRKLEETRLAMTSEASTAMLKRGVEIDTKPLEKLVEDLKKQERQYYHTLMGGVGIDPTEENINRMSQTMQLFDDLKSQPAYVLGQVEPEDSIETIYDTGKQLQQGLEDANESYETLMTSPRQDMGDTIQKAFSNVDDILQDLNLDTSEANRRAVRILAYNNTPITEESITSVKALDEQMQRTFHNMNPAVTLEMIRKGENPLDMDMEQLNQIAEAIKQESGHDEQERFNKYLWRLEQNHEITAEERSSYIGIYRLIAQVEKTDGAALGALMNQGSEITMRNLLTAVRSRKKGPMDYKISDDFEGVEPKTTGPKIDEQIEAGFQQNCLKDVLDRITPEKLAGIGEEKWESMTPEQLAEALAQMEDSPQEQQAADSYANEQLAMYRQVLDSPEEIYSYLDHYDIPNSMANVLAVSEMLRKPNQMMDKLFKENRFSQSSMEKIAALKQQVLEDFSESLENPEELADAQETLADVAEHVMDTMIIEDPNVSTMDIRAMRQIVAQFTLCAQKTKEECYMVPVQTGDSVTGVSLKIVRGKKEKGLVDILFDGGKLGKIAATIHAKEQGISGIIAAEQEDTRQLLLEKLGALSAAMQEGSEMEEAVDINVVCTSDLSFTQYEMAGISREEKMKEKGELAEDNTNEIQTRRLYHIAESFIQSIAHLQE